MSDNANHVAPDGPGTNRVECLDELIALLYEELRGVAHRQRRVRMSHRAESPTLTTTTLVSEAYLKMASQSPRWRDRAHFLSVAGVAMRQIIVDRARKRLADKRGGDVRPITLDADLLEVKDQAELVLQIDDALRSLGAVDRRLAQVVELKFFAGLSEDDTAQSLGVTVRTVQRDWAKARALLRRILEQ
jgi:RNA polymerase sigma factor (TIGR02999 family)